MLSGFFFSCFLIPEETGFFINAYLGNIKKAWETFP
jgi:hypothetical protein